MGINFPNAPTLGQLYPQPAVGNQPVYKWDGEKWTTQGGSSGAGYVKTTGDTMTGSLSINGASSSLNVGQDAAIGMSNPTAHFYFCDGGHNLAYDGTNYQFNGGSNLIVPNLFSVGAVTASGVITAGNSGTTGTYYFGPGGSKYLNYDGTNFVFNGGPVFAPSLVANGTLTVGFSGTTGTCYFGNAGIKYLTFDGNNFVFNGGALAASLIALYNGDYNTSFNNAVLNTWSYAGENSGAPNAPGSSGWWMTVNMRHSNPSVPGGVYGVQLAYGWAGNDNELYSRTCAGGGFSGWVRFLNSINFGNYALPLSGGKTTTGGFRFTSYALTLSGTVTPDAYNGNYQRGSNVGAFTLAAPANECAIDLLITNSATAGAITFSGYVGGTHGDTITTTNGYAFIISIRSIGGWASYTVKALQ